MLDMKLLRENPDKVKEALRNRNDDPESVDRALELDEKRRTILVEKERLQARRNELSKQVPAAKDPQERVTLIEESKGIGPRIAELDREAGEVEDALRQIMLRIPNVPHESVPVGKDDSANVVVRVCGEPKQFDFEPLAHWDLGTRLGMVDFETAGKITGSRFYVLMGLGARLERALLNFMLDLHIEQGYTEVFPPFLVNEASMIGTGQIPKFAEDMYKLAGDDLYLNPTGEVPVTNLLRDEILDAPMLPINYTAYTACFRREAGSAGKDVRGVIRVHQFNKVEMVKFAVPETSYDELEKLTANAEEVLQRLNLPYRVSALSTGDLGFSSAKTYDVEVWFPSQQVYREISSCSNFEDFQARRANIRYRPGSDEKPRFVHTLNGSGLAIGRTWAAIIENYQQEDGSIIIPGALRPYMGGLEVIRASTE